MLCDETFCTPTDFPVYIFSCLGSEMTSQSGHPDLFWQRRNEMSNKLESPKPHILRISFLKGRWNLESHANMSNFRILRTPLDRYGSVRRPTGSECWPSLIGQEVQRML